MRPSIVSIDIETTGLSPVTSAITILGAKPYQEDAIQWLNQTGLEQKEILADFIHYISSFDTIVTYNGTTFDLPFLSKKCEEYHLSNIFKEKNHIDLYLELKKIKHLFPWKNLKQKTIEDYFNINREDALSSKDMIRIYQDYIQVPSNHLKKQLLLHNKEDLIGLETISSLLCFRELCKGSFTILSSRVTHELEVYFKLDSMTGINCILKKNGFTLFIHETEGLLLCPLNQGKTYHYYPDTKDYYYLKADGVLLPSSMKSTIPKNERIHPTPDECFTLFMPTKEFLNSKEYIHTLCTHNIIYLLQKNTKETISIKTGHI